MIGQLHADKCDYHWISYLLADNSVICMLINIYCFTSHVYYFRLQIYDKTIIEFSLWFSPLEMYNKTIIGFGFCDMQNYQYLGKSYYQPRLRLG